MYAVNTASSLFNTGYNIHLQNRIFRREDNALQRAVLDAQKAGLSPLSVTGGANAGDIVSQSPVDFSQMNQLMQQQAELKLQQEQLDKQDQWHQNQIGVEQYNAETARINATTELLKASEDIALKNKEFGQHVEEFVYQKINDELNRRHQAELQASQQKHDIDMSKLNHEQNMALERLRSANHINSLYKAKQFEQDLQLFLSSNAFNNSKKLEELKHAYDVIRINIQQGFQGNQNAKNRAIQWTDEAVKLIDSILPF